MTISQDDGEREYMVLSQPMPDAGWTVSVLMDTGSLRTQVKTAMIAIILCLCLAAASSPPCCKGVVVCGNA